MTLWKTHNELQMKHIHTLDSPGQTQTINFFDKHIESVSQSFHELLKVIKLNNAKWFG